MRRITGRLQSACWRSLPAGLALMLAACTGGQRATIARPASTPQAYLQQALDVMQAHAVRASTVDWQLVTQEAFARAQGAQVPADTYPAIRYAVQQLGDHHSAFFTPAQVTQLQQGQSLSFGFLADRETGNVVRVDAGGPAAQAGLQVGDHIDDVNGLPLGAATAQPQATPISSLQITFRHPGQSAAVTVMLRTAAVSVTGRPTGRRVAGTIAYVEVPQVLGTAATAMTEAATAIQNAIRGADGPGVCGWVVDLRRNTGGTVGPMLAGIGPVLGDGDAGAFVSSGSPSAHWGYRSGAAVSNGKVITAPRKPSYTLMRPNPPVAVLTSHFTASAGEALVVAFRGRPSTHSFGEPTFGVPTGNALYPLSDGAGLNLTQALDADRTGQTYDAPLVPDERIAIDWTTLGTERDQALLAAIAWLETQPPCVH